ncbi:MAG: DUF6658 family protein [Pleurocapsa sp.]
MEKLIKIIKSIKLKQVLTVFLAGSLLIISTACSKGNVAQAGGREYTETSKRAMSDTYDDYDANQSFKGGMNGYNDDRRYDSGTAAKTKTLIDTAKRRQGDDLGDYAEQITDRAGNKIEQAQREIPRRVKGNLDNAAEYIDEKSDKLQDNLSKVPGESKKVFNQAVDNAQNAAEDLTKTTDKTTRNVKSNFEDLT